MAKIEDPRPGVGVNDGIPEIAWLPIQTSSEVTIKRVWHAETPDEEERVISEQNFSVTQRIDLLNGYQLGLNNYQTKPCLCWNDLQIGG